MARKSYGTQACVASFFTGGFTGAAIITGKGYHSPANVIAPLSVMAAIGLLITFYIGYKAFTDKESEHLPGYEGGTGLPESNVCNFIGGCIIGLLGAAAISGTVALGLFLSPR